MPEAAHPLPSLDELPRGRGWVSIATVDLDGKNWTLDFAAKILDFPERDLRDLVRISRMRPAGVMNMRGYRSSGRTPRAYPAEKLIRLTEAVMDLREDFPDSPDSDLQSM